MSDTNQDDRLRLVPLVATLAEIEEPQLDLSKVCDLAIRGEIRFYTRVPPDKVVYVDDFLPIVIHRRSSVSFRDMGDFTRYNPQSSQFHPEITHVALDPDHAGELKAASHFTSDMAFASGLMQHPDLTLAQAGWWVPCQFGASLVVCPAPTEIDDKKKRQHVRRTLLGTTPEDVYVDERVIAMLEDPEGTLDSDPYSLCRRAPGIYALYCVARHYHHAMEADKSKFTEVEKLIISLLSELGKTKAEQIAKLINPHHRRNRGVPKGRQRHFDAELLGREQFKSRYRRGKFIKDALALILYGTEKWLDLRASRGAGAMLTHIDRSSASEVFGGLGFYDGEEDALTELLLLRRATSRSEAWRKITSTRDAP